MTAARSASDKKIRAETIALKGSTDARPVVSGNLFCFSARGVSSLAAASRQELD